MATYTIYDSETMPGGLEALLDELGERGILQAVINRRQTADGEAALVEASRLDEQELIDVAEVWGCAVERG